MAGLQYKSRPQWTMGKKIQAAAYNGARTLFDYKTDYIRAYPYCVSNKRRIYKL